MVSPALSGKAMALELRRLWESMAQSAAADPELEYRLRKLGDRISAVADHTFFKTVKARDMLQTCSQQTASLQQRLRSTPPDPFYVLTRIEETFENLLKKTHEFRIKAG